MANINATFENVHLKEFCFAYKLVSTTVTCESPQAAFELVLSHCGNKKWSEKARLLLQRGDLSYAKLITKANEACYDDMTPFLTDGEWSWENEIFWVEGSSNVRLANYAVGSYIATPEHVEVRMDDDLRIQYGQTPLDVCPLARQDYDAACVEVRNFLERTSKETLAMWARGEEPSSMRD